MTYSVTSEMRMAFSKPLLKNHPLHSEKSMSGICSVQRADTQQLWPRVKKYTNKLQTLIKHEDMQWMKHPSWWKLLEALNMYGPPVKWADTEENSSEVRTYFGGWHCIDVFSYAYFIEELTHKKNTSLNLQMQTYLGVERAINRKDVGEPYPRDGSNNVLLHQQFLINAHSLCNGHICDIERILDFIHEGRCMYEFHMEHHLMAIVCSWMQLDA